MIKNVQMSSNATNCPRMHKYIYVYRILMTIPGWAYKGKISKLKLAITSKVSPTQYYVFTATYSATYLRLRQTLLGSKVETGRKHLYMYMLKWFHQSKFFTRQGKNTVDREIFALKIIRVKNFRVFKFSRFRSIRDVLLTVDDCNMDERLESSGA